MVPKVSGLKTLGVHGLDRVEGDKVPTGKKTVSLIQRQHVDIEKKEGQSWHLRVSSASRAIC